MHEENEKLRTGLEISRAKSARLAKKLEAEKGATHMALEAGETFHEKACVAADKPSIFVAELGSMHRSFDTYNTALLEAIQIQDRTLGELNVVFDQLVAS